MPGWAALRHEAAVPPWDVRAPGSHRMLSEAHRIESLSLAFSPVLSICLTCQGVSTHTDNSYGSGAASFIGSGRHQSGIHVPMAVGSGDFSWAGIILETFFFFHFDLGLIFKQMQHCQ